MTKTIQQKWLDKNITDDIFLAYTNKLKNTKRGKKLLIISGSHVIQYVDYKKLMDRDYEVLSMNLGYLLPYSEEFTYHFYGAMGYVGIFANCMTYKYFCSSFKGEHIFMCHTAKCTSPAYAICKADIVRACVRNNNIKNFRIVTHSWGGDAQRTGYRFTPSFDKFSPAVVPYGCGGSLNAMAIPFVFQLGYGVVAVAGIGDQDQRHFYDVAYIQPHLHKPYVTSRRGVTLERWKKWVEVANNNNIRFVTFPKAKIEQSIQNIIPTLAEGELP